MALQFRCEAAWKPNGRSSSHTAVSTGFTNPRHLCCLIARFTHPTFTYRRWDGSKSKQLSPMLRLLKLSYGLSGDTENHSSRRRSARSSTRSARPSRDSTLVAYTDGTRIQSSSSDCRMSTRCFSQREKGTYEKSLSRTRLNL